MSTDADRKYHSLHPVEAVADAWTEPGIDRHMHAVTRREITRLSPQLGRALDRLAKHDPAPARAEITRLATEAVAWSLSQMYPGDSDSEYWRKATAIVDRCVRAGLI